MDKRFNEVIKLDNWFIVVSFYVISGYHFLECKGRAFNDVTTLVRNGYVVLFCFAHY